MKKAFFFAVSAIIAIASCTKIDDSYTPDELLTFQAAVQLDQTKADINSSNTNGSKGDFPYNDFGVYAWEDGTQAFIANEAVTKSGSTWNTAIAHYWPKTSAVDFIGYYPQSATPWLTVGTDKLTCSAYTITGAKGEDLLYSDKAVDRTMANSGSGVPMVFHHALAKVGVVVKAKYLSNDKPGKENTTWGISIQDLYFGDMHIGGGVEINLDDQNKWQLPTNAIWTVDDQKSNLDIIDEEYAVKDVADTVLLEKVVMPQSVVGKKMYVVYSISTTTNGLTTTQSNITAEIPLYGTWENEADKNAFSNKVDNWQMNKWIFYTLIINPLQTDDPSESEIKFTPALLDWQYVNGGEYTI